MLTIRLYRQGKKNQPFYKIVVTEKSNAASKGRFVEEVGFYNPLTKEKRVDADRAKYWVSVGAQPSETIHNMLVNEKVIDAPKIPKHKKSKKEVVAGENTATAETPEGETANTPAETTEEPKTEGENQAAPEESAEPAQSDTEEKPEEQKKEEKKEETAPTEEPKEDTVVEDSKEAEQEEEKK